VDSCEHGVRLEATARRMSPLTTKLRLLYERAERTFRIAKADKERAWLAYMKQMREEGFCPNCEKPLQECKCVPMAAGGYDIPSTPYTVGSTHVHVSLVPRSIADKIRGKLPESEGPLSAPITSTETAESPARQSGSPEVDPSGERQCSEVETFTMYRMGPEEWD